MGKNIFTIDRYLNKNFLKAHNINSDQYRRQIEKHNRAFIDRKMIEYREYFDTLFTNIDSKIILDEEQRKAILTDEDYNLIVAGAGAGKTTTMTAKIKYMVDKCHIPENEILAISFARKNVKELEEKLNGDFHLHIKTMTFHQLGNWIIQESEENKSSVIEDSEKYECILDYLKHDLYRTPSYLARLVHFLSCYFHGDKEMERFSSLEDYHNYKTETLFKTLKGNLNEYNETIIDKRKSYHRSIHSEYLRSNEEVMIANFLYLYGLDYTYEERYQKDKKQDYHPDFTIRQGENIIYLEHYGIHENGSSSLYTKDERYHYIHTIKMKDQLHFRNGSKLIKTFSKFNDGRPLLDHLKELLEENHFILKRRSEEEIFYELQKGNIDSYFYPYVILVLDFISQFKLNCYQNLSIDDLLTKTTDDRTKKFLLTTKPIFEHYQNHLKNHHLIDFEEMITKAILIMDEKKENTNFPYKYIVIDEYQDISKQRYDLVKRISDYFHAQIIAVGDDWQSIFGFAGSNVELFSKFQEAMGYGEILKIRHTYRNAQELIDTAGKFVQRDRSHIRKQLLSNKHIAHPIVVYSYEDDDYTRNINHIKAISVSKAIANILQEKEDSKIMLIGRYNFDLYHLCQSGLFKKREGERVECLDYPEADIEFYTVHRAKGLEFDNTIIINAINSTYGFPSKVKDDPIFEIFDKKKENLAYAEERRLFYVALTRTKNKVYIIVPKSHPSPFVLELKKDRNVEFKDDVIEQYEAKSKALHCPKCHSPLKREYSKTTQGFLYRCTQEKELCDFQTVELKYKIPIEKCPDCSDGYLIFKTELDNGILIGCTNYKETKDGCNCHHIIHRKVKQSTKS